MTARVYILYSKSINKFYTGFTTETVETRIERHNFKYYDNKFTSITNDWTLFHAIECETVKQARNIEAHIKRMKSRKYIENLKLFPEIQEKLLIKYKDS